MIAARAGDGRFAPFRFPIDPARRAGASAGGGDDPAAWLKDVTPFVLRDPDLFRARKPHALHTQAYAADFNEVKAIGPATSSTRTHAQTAAANYWGLTNPTATMASASARSRTPRAAASPTTRGRSRARTRTSPTR